MMRPVTLRPIMSLLVAVGAASLLGGCGRTLLFAESDGVNLAVRANTSSDTPVEVNFGLNRTVGTIVPPAGQKSGNQPDGEAVNMLAGFEVINNYNTVGAVDVDLTVDTQFASGKAAKKVAENPEAAAKIANLQPVPISTTASAKAFRAWLFPNNTFSQTRFTAVQAWLNKRYPGKNVPPYYLYNYDSDQYEADRVAALNDLKDVPAN